MGNLHNNYVEVGAVKEAEKFEEVRKPEILKLWIDPVMITREKDLLETKRSS